MPSNVLLVIDMQKGMMQKDVYEKQVLTENINKLLDCFHTHNNSVFLFRHTNDSYSKQDSEAWQLIDGLHISDTDIIINKNQSSVFKDKNFIKTLEKLDADRIVISGLVTNGCIKAACSDAKKSGYNVTLISDAHSTFHKDAPQVIEKWNLMLADEEINVLNTNEYLNKVK